MRIECLDHLVPTAADIPATMDLYVRVLGMEHVENEGRHALMCGRQKIDPHQGGHAFEPKAAKPTPGSGDLRLITTQHFTDIAVYEPGAKGEDN